MPERNLVAPSIIGSSRFPRTQSSIFAIALSVIFVCQIGCSSKLRQSFDDNLIPPPSQALLPKNPKQDKIDAEIAAAKTESVRNFIGQKQSESNPAARIVGLDKPLAEPAFKLTARTSAPAPAPSIASASIASNNFKTSNEAAELLAAIKNAAPINIPTDTPAICEDHADGQCDCHKPAPPLPRLDVVKPFDPNMVLRATADKDSQTKPITLAVRQPISKQRSANEVSRNQKAGSDNIVLRSNSNQGRALTPLLPLRTNKLSQPTRSPIQLASHEKTTSSAKSAEQLLPQVLKERFADRSSVTPTNKAPNATIAKLLQSAKSDTSPAAMTKATNVKPAVVKGTFDAPVSARTEKVTPDLKPMNVERSAFVGMKVIPTPCDKCEQSDCEGTCESKAAPQPVKDTSTQKPDAGSFSFYIGVADMQTDQGKQSSPEDPAAPKSKTEQAPAQEKIASLPALPVLNPIATASSTPLPNVLRPFRATPVEKKTVVPIPLPDLKTDTPNVKPFDAIQAPANFSPLDQCPCGKADCDCPAPCSCGKKDCGCGEEKLTSAPVAIPLPDLDLPVKQQTDNGFQLKAPSTQPAVSKEPITEPYPETVTTPDLPDLAALENMWANAEKERTAKAIEKAKQDIAVDAKVTPWIETKPATSDSVSVEHVAPQPPITPKPVSLTDQLDRSIKQLERQQGEVQSDDAQNKTELNLRLLRLLKRQMSQGSDASIGRSQSQTIQHQLDALNNMLVQDSSQEATLDHLKRAVKELEAQADLRVTAGVLCTQISGFGKFKTFASSTFSGNQKMLIYCEVENQTATRREIHSDYRTRLRGSFVIYNQDGDIVQQKEFPMIEDLARSPRRDFYLYFPTQLNNLAVGNYRLEVMVEDIQGNKSASLKPAIPFSVR